MDRVSAHHVERAGLKLTRSKVHSILSNKAYVGVRATDRRDSASAQEVPAVWKPTIDPETFELVQVPFGWDLHDARFAENGAEQQVIRLMRQFQGSGEFLNAIARELNRSLVPTKNAGLPGSTRP